MFKWLQSNQLARIQDGRMPWHIAIIMDGNGRWARKRGLPRVAGHRAGMEAIRRTLEALRGLNVGYLTLYAFSTENWKRPRAEVDFLMDLPGQFMEREMAAMMQNNIRMNMLGQLEGLPAHTRQAVAEGLEKTKANTGLNLTFALNYGSRDELVRAAAMICAQAGAGQLSPEDVTHDLFSSFLSTANIPDPDLVIRTSGEQRLSNFMLWQVAYSELYFTKTLWPDFSATELYKAIGQYQARQRRFGGV